ncbi:MAG: hypothetical protein ABUT20_30500, partial [Bacteroidota bacterium]
GKENFKKYSFVLDRINENEKENRVLLLKKMGLESGTLQSKQLLMKEQQAGIDDLIAKTDAKTNLPPSDQLLLLKAQQEELQNKIQLLEADQNLQTELQANNNLQLLKARQFDLQNKKIPDDKLSLLKTNDKLQLLKSQQFDIQNKNQLLLDDKLNLQNEVLANNKLELLKDDQLSFEKQSALNNNLALQRLQSIQSVLPNDEIEDIIDILSDAGVVKDKHDLSFTLNFNELIVNGKKQEKSLYNMLKEKYIKGKKDHYIYKTNGHSTSTDISKE